MKSREVSCRDTRTGGICTDEVLDTETSQSAALGQERTLATARLQQKSQEEPAELPQSTGNSPVKIHRLTRQ